jgi:prepilin-type N-terminal cleavage/methylation domain-containing protein
MFEEYSQYLQYIKNTGGSPKIEWFDTDWEPIGPRVREGMKRAGLIYEKDGKVFAAKKNGFTLIELLVVLVIIGCVIGVFCNSCQ